MQARGELPKLGVFAVSALAQSRHRDRAEQCPLLGAKPTRREPPRVSASDPLQFRYTRPVLAGLGAGVGWRDKCRWAAGSQLLAAG